MAQYLLSQGANINAQVADAHNRHTVLMHASDIAMAQYLLEHGADPNIRAASGENAYEMQMKQTHQRSYLEVAGILKQALL